MGRFGKGVAVDDAAYIHESVYLYGEIKVGEGSSLWPFAVGRAEMKEIIIGKMSNIQDFVMLHVGSKTGTYVGDYCSITHHCTLHGCTIGNYCLVGINSTIMDGCVIGDNCIIAGHTFLKEGTVIPDNSIVMGTPGKVVKVLNCRRKNKLNALLYYKNALAYAKGSHRAWTLPQVYQDIEKTLGAAFSD